MPVAKSMSIRAAPSRRLLPADPFGAARPDRDVQPRKRPVEPFVVRQVDGFAFAVRRAEGDSRHAGFPDDPEPAREPESLAHANPLEPDELGVGLRVDAVADRFPRVGGWERFRDLQPLGIEGVGIFRVVLQFEDQNVEVGEALPDLIGGLRFELLEVEGRLPAAPHGHLVGIAVDRATVHPHAAAQEHPGIRGRR